MTVTPAFSANVPIAQLPIESLAVAITYTGTLVETMTVVYEGITYVKTFSNDGTNITNISQWVAQ